MDGMVRGSTINEQRLGHTSHSQMRNKVMKEMPKSYELSLFEIVRQVAWHLGDQHWCDVSCCLQPNIVSLAVEFQLDT
jgi:hypothetical protein